MKSIFLHIATMTFCLGLHAAELPKEGDSAVLFEDGFGALRSGSLGSVLGAHAEYHYLPETGPKGNWAISTFSSSGLSQRAWRAAQHDGKPVLLQTYENKLTHTHPMVVGGDALWQDYTVTVKFAPSSDRGGADLFFAIAMIAAIISLGSKASRLS